MVGCAACTATYPLLARRPVGAVMAMALKLVRDTVKNEIPVYPYIYDELTNTMQFPYLRIDEWLTKIDEIEEHTFWSGIA